MECDRRPAPLRCEGRSTPARSARSEGRAAPRRGDSCPILRAARCSTDSRKEQMKIAEACAVVSGGASGLGRAVAERVLAEGGRCALLDVNEEQGTKAAAALGKRALFIRTDVSDEKSVNAAVEQARTAMGRVTLAVSCAGILGAGRVLGKEGPMPGEQFIRTIQVNLVGTFLLTKAAAHAMQDNTPNEEGERGVIVNTASVAAFEGQIGQVAYSASKSGVAGMTLPIAREL